MGRTGGSVSARYGSRFALAVTILGSTSAHAGLLAGFSRKSRLTGRIIDEETANDLDAWHEDMGRPLDHALNRAAGAAVDSSVPGACKFVTEGFELRDAIRRNELNRFFDQD
jgi:hypothetical protein